MDRDDAPIGRLLSRRDAVLLLGATSGIVLTGGSYRGLGAGTLLRPGGPACVARPEQTEGPYFVDEKLDRSDIRTDPTTGAESPGLPLDLTFNVSRVAAGSCEPLAGAWVDVWQCDHLGVYSDARDASFNTVGKKFLRGYQVTGAAGQARFTTIYPGWYSGRAVHIHFKVRSAPSAGRGFDFTSQLYFDDAFTDKVHARPPYATKGQRNQRNSGDGIFRRGGSQLLVDVTETGGRGKASFDIGLQL